MKQIFLIISILFFSISMKSQITKGYWMYGGSGDYTHNTIKLDNGTTSKYSTITINPSAGYFIKDNWAIGGMLRYMNFRSSYSGDTDLYGLGILTRYYFLKPNKITNIFAQVNYTYAINKAGLNSNSQFYGVKIGHVIFLTNSVGLETFFEYEKAIYNTQTHTKIKIGMGFHIHLQKK